MDTYLDAPDWSDWKAVSPSLHTDAEAVRSEVRELLQDHKGRNGGAVLRGMMLALADLRHDQGITVTQTHEDWDVSGLRNAQAQVRMERSAKSAE
jgi:hypothetical protein